MKLIRFLSRIIVGIVFLFSGFVKAIDPLGSTYKFQDYFTSFGLENFHAIAFALAVLLSSAELLIGFALFTGLRMRITSWVLLGFMSFFTILTLFIAIKNPVTDCGCFGDALVITNWETFWKNVILMVPTLIVLWQRDKFREQFYAVSEWSFILGFFILAISLNVYSYRNLPMLDFRPYKTGANIPEGMEIPEGELPDEYQTILTYEKDGVQKEFTSKDYPWQDTTWKWVSSKTVLVKKGYEPPVHDFEFTTPDGYDITDDVLSNPGYTFLVVAYDVTKSDKLALSYIDKLYEVTQNNGYGFVAATSALPEQIENVTSELGLNFEFCTADKINLKTIIRSNPGLLLLKEGTIIGKWHYNKFPCLHKFQEKDLLSFSIGEQQKQKNKLLVLTFILGFLTMLLSVRGIFKKLDGK